MAQVEYRLYRLRGRRVLSVIDLVAENDDDAIRQALAYQRDDALELWCPGGKIIWTSQID
jgi:hypothetical protein